MLLITSILISHTDERGSNDYNPPSLGSGCYGVGLCRISKEEDILFEPRHREGARPVWRGRGHDEERGVAVGCGERQLASQTSTLTHSAEGERLYN